MPKRPYDFEIQCPHIRVRGALPFSETHEDHYPLTRDGVIKLLRRVRDNYQTDSLLISAVAIRFTQAVPGCTCPAPADGSVASRIVKVERIMADWDPGRDFTGGMVDALMHLFEG